MSVADAFAAILQHSHAEYSAGKIRPDLAESWSNGEHEAKMRVLNIHWESNDRHLSGEKNAYSTSGRGVGVQTVVEALTGCIYEWRNVEDRLAESPSAEDATKIYIRSDGALDEYWKLLRIVKEKMKKDDIRKHIGDAFVALLKGNLKASNAAGERIVSQVCPKLDSGKAEKLREWTATTKKNLEEACNAAATGKV